MTNLRILQVDPNDLGLLVQWNELARNAYTDGRQATWWRSDEATVEQFANPRPGRASVLLMATIDEHPAGTLEAHTDPGSPTDVEIGVLPRFRRRGIGQHLAATALALGPQSSPLWQSETYTDAGVHFAKALGLEVANKELRLILNIEDLRNKPLEVSNPNGIEITSWTGPCPPELLMDWVRLTTQMSEDAPLGDLTRPATLDADATIRNDLRMEQQGAILIRSIAKEGDTSVGYTEIYASRHDPRIVSQDDTLVERTHRGRGIARAMKLANLRQLLALPFAGEIEWIQTYTAPDNAPMLALNRTIGFSMADVMTQLEGQPTPGSPREPMDPSKMDQRVFIRPANCSDLGRLLSRDL